ncbi:MAG: hypothetical protein VB089_20025, partial [Anaerolineaceae bacterium]|nr:hypothetical protein [Anaerolineaceae bacterium]
MNNRVRIGWNMIFRRFALPLTIFIILLTPAAPVAAQSETTGPDEPYGGLPLCLPDAYLADPQDCLPLGPSQVLTDQVKSGIPYPQLPMQVTKPSASLNELELRYARIAIPNEEQAYLYGSLESAVAGENPLRYISGGLLRYVAYTSQVDVGGGHYVQLQSGEWMRASPGVTYSTFQGLLFLETPKTSFGWIVEDTQPQTAADFQAPFSGDTLTRETLVQIYDVQRVGEVDWYMVGLNEWVQRRYIRQFEISTTPPKGMTGNRWIEINLYEQTMGVYDNGQLV